MKRHLLILLILLVAGTAMAQSYVSDLVVTLAFSAGTINWYDIDTGQTILYPTNPSIEVLQIATKQWPYKYCLYSEIFQILNRA